MAQGRFRTVELQQWLDRTQVSARVGYPPRNIVFLSSVDGTASGNGQSQASAVTTLALALAKCSANKGDVICAMPGHVESSAAAAGLAVTVAGVTIIGFGLGSDRPTFTMGTAVGATFDVSADNVWIDNVIFSGGLDALSTPVRVDGHDCKLTNIETRDTTGQATDFIAVGSKGTVKNRLTIDGWIHRGAAAAGADTALTIVGGEGHLIKNFWVDGNFAVGCIENVTTAATNLNIIGGRDFSYLRTRNAADIAIQLTATTTGNIGPNINIRLQDDAANITECITVGNDCQLYLPINVVNADAEVSLAYNGTASTD